MDLRDQSLALQELQLDPAFSLIPPGARADYVTRSLAIGADAATPYRGCDPAELADRLGARTMFDDSPLETTGSVVRSEYDAGTRTITIYTRSIAGIMERLKEAPTLRILLSLDPLRDLREPILNAEPAARAADMDQAIYKTIANIHIAHELFHHLEETRIGRTDERLPPVSLRRIGPFEIGAARVRRCREIAAHAFAKTLMDLPLLPNAIDLCV